MFETLAGQARQAFRLLIRTVEDSPWLFIALAVVHTGSSHQAASLLSESMLASSLFPSGIDVAST